MEAILLAAGLGCLVAAVVGGQNKAAGWDFPPLKDSQRYLLAMLGIVLIIAAYAERIHKDLLSSAPAAESRPQRASEPSAPGGQPLDAARTAVPPAREPALERSAPPAAATPAIQNDPVREPAYLTVRVRPESADVTVNGEPYHSTMTFPNGGTFKIRAEAAEHSPDARIVRLEPGDQREVAIVLKACRREPVTETVSVRGQCDSGIEAEEIKKSFRGADCFRAYDAYLKWCQGEIGGTPYALPLENPASACHDGRTLAGICYVCTRQEEKQVGTKLICD